MIKDLMGSGTVNGEKTIVGCRKTFTDSKNLLANVRKDFADDRKFTSTTVQKGKKGEDLAVKYLLEKGYKIIDRNYHAGHKEIDIIAELPDTLVFVEVKWRESDLVSSPFDAVNFRKQQNLFRVANSYVISRKINKDVRFDIIGIVGGKGQNNIEHIEGAFSAFGG